MRWKTDDKIMDWIFNNFGKIWTSIFVIAVLIMLLHIFGIGYLATHADCFGIDTRDDVIKIRTDLCK